MLNVEKAQKQLTDLIVKYKVRLTEKQIASIRSLEANALKYDPTGKIWLTAINKLEKTLEELP